MVNGLTFFLLIAENVCFYEVLAIRDCTLLFIFVTIHPPCLSQKHTWGVFSFMIVENFLT